MRSAVVLLAIAVLILSACAPVAAPTAAVLPAPSETPAPSATPAPTETPTRTPTATPTPIPTLPPQQVGGLEGVPDPRVSNPELFDLENPNAPIPQYVNAMGLWVNEVWSRLQNQDVFITLNIGEEPRLLIVDPQTRIPLFIREGDKFRRVGLRDFEMLFGEAGDSLVYKRSERNGFAVINSEAYHLMLATNYDVLTIAQGFYWKWLERAPGVIDPYSKGDILSQMRILKEIQQQNPNLRIRVSPFGSFPETNPAWLRNLSGEEARRALRQHMQWVYDILRENGITPSEYVVVNEPFFQGSGWIREDALYRVAGGYGYITQAFLDAREIVGPDAILILNDTANNSLRPGPYNYYTELTRKLVDQLREARVTNFAVGMQMHLRGDYPVDEEDLIATMRYYGVPVYITELDVDVSMLPSGKREQALVDFYTTVFRAAIRSGVCRGISTWNGVDDLSTPVDYEGNIDAQPTMFVGIDNPTPKRVYYEVLRLLLNELSRQ